jgi:HSP20 family protein
MTLMRFDPFRELDRLTERALPGGMRAMPAEAFRRGDEFFVLLDVPGVDPDKVNVTVERNVVNVAAEFTSPRQDGDELILDERPHGRSTRQFFLGENLDAPKLRAEYERGVLTLTIPVAEQSKPRRVQIDSNAQRTVDIGSQTESGSSSGTGTGSDVGSQQKREPAHA